MQWCENGGTRRWADLHKKDDVVDIECAVGEFNSSETEGSGAVRRFLIDTGCHSHLDDYGVVPQMTGMRTVQVKLKTAMGKEQMAEAKVGRTCMYFGGKGKSELEYLEGQEVTTMKSSNYHLFAIGSMIYEQDFNMCINSHTGTREFISW